MPTTDHPTARGAAMRTSLQIINFAAFRQRWGHLDSDETCMCGAVLPYFTRPFFGNVRHPFCQAYPTFSSTQDNSVF
jgi:hypothetical protein